MVKVIEKIIHWLVIGLVFLLPLFFLPTTSEFFIFNKQTLLFFSVGVLLILWAFKLFEKRTFIFKTTPFDLPVLLLALAFVLSTLFASPSRIEDLLNSTGTGTILALAGLFFIITNNLNSRKSFNWVILSLTASGSLLGLIALGQTLGLTGALGGPEWLQNKFFTPSGGPLILLMFLGFNFFLAVLSFLKSFNRKSWLLTAGFFLMSLLIILGMTLTFYQVAADKGARFTLLPFKSGWAVAIEAFKQSPLLGVGPGNFIAAFNRFRPVSFNNYEYWNTRFAQSSNYPLELLTIGGLLALGSYLFLLLKTLGLWLKQLRLLAGKDLVLKEALKNIPHEILLAGIFVLILIQLFLPINFLILFSFIVLLAFLGITQENGKTLAISSKPLTAALLGITSALVLVVFFFWGRAYLADFHFRRSLNALAQNQGLNTYNSQIKAINLNPQLPRYRRSYSQTNFALANSIASQGDLSDQDRNNISLLIQQSIDEAKRATVLNQTDANNWENLAQLYRNLINFAQGADQWTIAAYRQSIATDPINPRIRLNLGGLYFSLQNYDEAIRHFQDAINLKPDFANAYYNLAAAYREQAKYQQAYLALQAASNLVPADSADFQTLLDEMAELKDKLPIAPEATPSAATGELTKPEPLPSPAIEPPIELPEESGPATEEAQPKPTGQITPSAVPTETPEPNPEP